MKTLRIIFISILIITIVAAVIIGNVSAGYAADNGDKMGLALEPFFTVMLVIPLCIAELIIYRSVAFLFVKKKRESQAATVLKVLSLILAIIIIPANYIILFHSLCKLETIFLIPLICLVLDCAGSIAFQKKTRGIKTSRLA